MKGLRYRGDAYHCSVLTGCVKFCLALFAYYCSVIQFEYLMLLHEHEHEHCMSTVKSGEV